MAACIDVRGVRRSCQEGPAGRFTSLPFLPGGSQRVDHPVHGGGHGPDLIGPIQGRLDGEVSLADLPGGTSQTSEIFRQRTRDRGGQQSAEDDPQPNCDDHQSQIM